MTMVDVVWNLRLISTVLWLVLMGYHAPALWRILTNQMEYHDGLFGLGFFFAALLFGFNMRWILAPHDMGTWAGLYILSILCAFAAIKVARSYRRD